MRLKTASVAVAVLGAFGTTLVLQGALAADLGPPLALRPRVLRQSTRRHRPSVIAPVSMSAALRAVRSPRRTSRRQT